MPQFAQGLLEATGRKDGNGVAWTGTPRAITTLACIIRDATGVGHPATTESHRRMHITWTDPKDVERLQNWMSGKDEY
jgi:hypothetical protein